MANPIFTEPLITFKSTWTSRAPYAESNETMPSANKVGDIRPGTYLGIGSHQNLDYISSFRPDHAIIVDMDTHVAKHMAAIKVLSKAALNPIQLIACYGSFGKMDEVGKGIISDPDLLTGLDNFGKDYFVYHNYSFEYSRKDGPGNYSYNMNYLRHALKKPDYLFIREYLTSPLAKGLATSLLFPAEGFFSSSSSSSSMSWLKELESFNYIIKLCKDDKLAVLNGKINDPEVLQTIADGIRSIGFISHPRLSSAYFSNVDEWINGTVPDRKSNCLNYISYLKALNTLPWDDKAIVVRSLGGLRAGTPLTAVLKGFNGRFWEDAEILKKDAQLYHSLFMMRYVLQKIADVHPDLEQEKVSRDIAARYGYEYFGKITLWQIEKFVQKYK